MIYQFSSNPEINNMLNRVVQSITALAENQVAHIKRLTRIGESLSSETDLHKIWDMMLEEAVEFTNADGATIYQVSEDKKYLDFEVLFNGTMKLRLGGVRGPVGWPSIPLYDENGNPRLSNIVTNVYHLKRSLCFDDVYIQEEFDVSGTKKADKDHDYRSKSMLTIPLKNHEDEVLGVIQIINAMDNDGNIVGFTEDHKTMLNSLASQAAIALSNRKLIDDLESLLMQFMRSIATGIERKSKYSSDHIMRVAMLTDMIAAKLNASDSGHFKDLMFTDDQLKELSMAGWMHDVGKIITPEFIMDKSTKLETIMDRIDLVSKRFEMMHLVLELMQKSLEHSVLDQLIKEVFGDELDSQSVHKWLDDAFQFISRLNFGGEFVPDADLERVAKIASIKLSYQDKDYILLSENETVNLQIRRGTLTSDEMKQMSAHVSVTWDMLSQLSFPKKYKNVAFYASTHHEKLNGKGYPKGLTADDLPLQSRIIAVADIFEALTAADRPYKKAKTLSESLKIMAFCVKDGDLDQDLLDFFMDSGLYLDFAKQYMKEDQIDSVDIEALKKLYQKQ
ncbi:MAG: metal-dependent phosphohydrolase [Candidatus Cloacimonetes bacterium HGW-Cloacimonetes-2]|jgi:HD-GYP domain-containing protein (c-di-GMP phosphodiesterase class II)|nr:MAG: metal-dependent phosphohydrolase [Candidatus Cloacimonetes bacterium HGW-Cloacimonetes-2]